MKQLTVRLLAVAALATVMALPATASTVVSSAVNVYVGYFNNIGGEPSAADIPTPFDNDATTTLLGLGPSSADNDTGVIRFENTSSQNVTIGRFLLAVAGDVAYQPWGQLDPFVLAPGHNLVLSASFNYNFDSSDSITSEVPHVFGTINGRGFAFDDNGRVLYGREDAVNALETTPYSLIGSVQVPVPVPGAALLFGSALAGFAAIGRRRAA